MEKLGSHWARYWRNKLTGLRHCSIVETYQPTKRYDLSTKEQASKTKQQFQF